MQSAPHGNQGVDDEQREEKEGAYWPAYLLSDWSLERAGRVSAPSIRVTRTSSGATEVTDSTTSQATTTIVSTTVVEAAATALVSGDSCVENGDRGASTDMNSPAIPAKTTTSPSAALLIIGDEILNGFTTESNLRVASQALGSIGIPLKRVSVVADSIEEIAEEVQRLSQRYDLVFTSGGIGPTHDDVTLRAVARAVGQEMAEHDEMLTHLQIVQKEQADRQGSTMPLPPPALDEGMRRLAWLPAQSRLCFPPPPDDYYHNGGTSQQRNKTWPVLQVENIFVLPGVPQFFAAKMTLLAKHFLPRAPVQEVRKIVLDIEERNLVMHLDALVQRCPRVKIGSYPFVDHPQFKTIITLEAAQAGDVDDAVHVLVEALPSQAVLRVERGQSTPETETGDGQR